MEYSKHARERMAQRSITEADVTEVLKAPAKMAPADFGCTNFWGYGPSGKRIRVTVDPTNTLIITVADAEGKRA